MAMETVFILSSLNQAGASGYCAIRCAAPAGTWVLARTQRSACQRPGSLPVTPASSLPRALIRLEPGDPRARAEKPVPTFGEVAQLVIADAKRKSANAKVHYQ
jgi:hypothetical protein